MVSKGIDIIDGDLLEQHVSVIVNSWNRNIFPHWLLMPQGVSKAIRIKAGSVPFKELAKYGILPLGSAVLTSAGNLPYEGIIHVAGINLLWMASEKSVRLATENALILANHKFNSIAFPLIGSGTGNMNPDFVQTIMVDEFKKSDYDGNIILVKFNKQ